MACDETNRLEKTGQGAIIQQETGCSQKRRMVETRKDALPLTVSRAGYHETEGGEREVRRSWMRR